jgi:transposase
VTKQAFTAWLIARPNAWRDGLEVVAMDCFTGFRTATPPKNYPMRPRSWTRSPFVRLTGDALDVCRRRVHQDTRGHRKNDPLHRALRTPNTGVDVLTDRQRQRLTALFSVDEHV